MLIFIEFFQKCFFDKVLFLYSAFFDKNLIKKVSSKNIPCVSIKVLDFIVENTILKFWVVSSYNVNIRAYKNKFLKWKIRNSEVKKIWKKSDKNNFKFGVRYINSWRDTCGKYYPCFCCKNFARNLFIF